MSIQDGCTLSNHPIVGVHNISKERLLIEFTDRRMPIPPLRYFVCPTTSGQAAVGVNVAKYHHLPGRGSQLFRGKVASFGRGSQLLEMYAFSRSWDVIPRLNDVSKSLESIESMTFHNSL